MRRNERITVGNRITSRWAPIGCLKSLAACGVLAASGTVFSAPQTNGTSFLVVSDPTSVSVSRANGPTFYVEYKVTVTNNSSNNNQTYDFKGTTLVTKDANNQATNPVYFSSTGVPCQAINATQITCAKLSVDKNSSKTFSVVYKTPSLGAKLRFTIESTSNAIKGSGFAETELITVPNEQTIVGFYTFVPKEGGTFFTGANGNLAGSPGGVATPGDPWTTTVYIPPIPFTTTARATERQNGELPSCSPLYVGAGCFDTDLVIPSAPGAIATMTVYLRIDKSKINLIGNNIASAVIRYAKDGINFVDVAACTATNVAISGKPCIRERKAYGFTGVPADWQLDWEFRIEAVDNGRYAN